MEHTYAELADSLRHSPLNQLAIDEATKMIRMKHLVDLRRNPTAAGVLHRYGIQRISSGYFANDCVIIDSTTDLMWQWMGSYLDYYNYEGALKYVTWLNKNQFAGYADWRLPTLEEAMSIIEVGYRFERRHDGNIQLGLVFPQNTEVCWTCDRNGDQQVWQVDYSWGSCELVDLHPRNVHLRPTGAIRAVRIFPRPTESDM